MISHHDRCIFVHVPKCAGQSVEMFFLHRTGLDWERRSPLLLRFNEQPTLGPPRLAHLRAADYVEKKWITPEHFNSYFKFTFVRNPWDRTASFYRYLGYDRRCSFSTFVTRDLQGQIAKKPWFLGPQADFIYDSSGKPLVDFIGRFETLATDFATICERMGIAERELPHVNGSQKARAGVREWLRRKAMPYREMYNDRTRAIVGALYAEDVEAFEYEF